MKEPIHFSFLYFQRDFHQGQHEIDQLIPGDFGWVLGTAGSHHHDGRPVVVFLQQQPGRERAIETQRY